MQKYSVTTMRAVTDSIRESVDMLINLEYEINEMTNVLLYYIIESKIDPVTMAHYENSINIAGAARTYSNVMEYLQNRIQNRKLYQPRGKIKKDLLQSLKEVQTQRISEINKHELV